MQTAVNRDRATGKHHDRGEIKRVESNPGDGGAPVHDIECKPKEVSAVTAVTLQFKMNPAKDERESN